MNKADYVAIAAAISEAKRVVEHTVTDAELKGSALSALRVATVELSTVAWSRYKGAAAYNRQKFVNACGFPEA